MEIENVVIFIRETIEDLRTEEKIDSIIKDGIFDILKSKCTIIYYPMSDEDNRGFHIRRLVNDEMRDFVYINTAKSYEQQIFTAAHELGHIWNVYPKVVEKASASGINLDEKDNDDEEKVVDRFAAELLMPEKEFRDSVNHYTKEFEMSEDISVVDLLKMIAKLMGEYMSPYNAVRKRLHGNSGVGPH